MKVKRSGELKSRQWHIGKSSPFAMFGQAVLQLAQNRLKLPRLSVFEDATHGIGKVLWYGMERVPQICCSQLSQGHHPSMLFATFWSQNVSLLPEFCGKNLSCAMLTGFPMVFIHFSIVFIDFSMVFIDIPLVSAISHGVH